MKADQMKEGKSACVRAQASSRETSALRKHSDHRHVCARRSGSHFNHHTTDDGSPPTHRLSEKPGCNWSNSLSNQPSERPSLFHSFSCFSPKPEGRAQATGK